jgi:hypothetical protein
VPKLTPPALYLCEVISEHRKYSDILRPKGIATHMVIERFMCSEGLRMRVVTQGTLEACQQRITSILMEVQKNVPPT